MRWKRKSVAKLLLTGTLIAAVLPPGIDWEMVYASATSSANVVRSDQELQKTLLNAMNQRLSQVQFVYQGKTNQLKGQLKNALEQALESDPYMNYTIESYGYSYSGSSKSANVSVQLSYRETAEQTAYVAKRVQGILGSIIKPGMNDHEKIKAIHDWIVLHLRYDETLRKYTAYDGLSSGSTVCQGYSLLTYKMLKEAGITNRIVEGTAAPRDTGVSQLHAWNLVLLDGKWYHLDTTWDDPAPDKPGEIGIGYYLRTDAQMRKDHSWTKSYPAANTPYRETLSQLISRNDSHKAYYQKLERELEYQLYDPAEIVSTSSALRTKVRAVIKQGGNSLLLRYHGSHEDLMDDLQDLYRLGVRSVSYVESDLDETNDLRVYVTWK
ncbi:transglutaminase domain-containing protein [Paenibacillus chibensis]|uniref:transglutaminase domain-containing protein n=1 Tax=Paenibacillus chibensis TaxID=59846 RepID=UPI000FDC4695|nr:transglutaminase domain-containing protein [Paenibacillus chibensis]MEC0372680.1 transglutaminase domain-containing protein [Paenibacillus chibensis]